MGRWEPPLTRNWDRLGELGPPGQLAGDGVGRSSLHNNPTGHEAADLVTASPQKLLYTTLVGFELGHQGSDVLAGCLMVLGIAGAHAFVALVVAARAHSTSKDCRVC